MHHGERTDAHGFSLQCINGNYLSSLSHVREELAKPLPVYHRRVPIPINAADATGTSLMEHSAFYNRQKEIMIRKVEQEGFGQWVRHKLTPAMEFAARHPPPGKMPCTFGIPRTSMFSPTPERAHSGVLHEEHSCSRMSCACHDEVYEERIGSLSRRSHAASPNVTAPTADAVAVAGGRHLRSTISKYLEPLRHVKSHNLFQRILSSPLVTSRLANSTTTIPPSRGSVNDTSPREATVGDTLGSTPCASRGSTTVSFSPTNNPPKMPKKSAVALRGDRSLYDLNAPVQVSEELDDFEKREVLRHEREEFMKITQSLSSPSVRH